MSVPFDAANVCTWTRGELLAGDGATRIDAVTLDSRQVRPGCLFVAVSGPNHDGHDYLAQAAEAGAAALLVARDRALPALPARVAVAAVADTTRALGQLAAGHREDFDGPLIAITGSNGKTTTKEMCAGILAIGAPTLATRGNLNNHYGLPLTLLAREPEHRRAVVELGMNHRGEIAPLAAIARPDVAAVTNIGTAHIEHLGSREAIAAEKGDLIAALPPDGVAVVPEADDFGDALAARAPGRVLRFGLGESADVRASDLKASAAGFRFALTLPDGAAAVEIAGLGITTVVNALCAAAAAHAAGIGAEEIAAGLARHRGVPGRLERRELANGVRLIDDSYNANPQSMAVALHLLADCAGGRRIAVLGDMGELGEATEAAHRDAGALVARLGIDHLVAVGDHACGLARAAREAGMSDACIACVETSDAAGPPVGALARSGDWVLLKGSRSMRMERVADHLEAEARA